MGRVNLPLERQILVTNSKVLGMYIPKDMQSTVAPLILCDTRDIPRPRRVVMTQAYPRRMPLRA